MAAMKLACKKMDHYYSLTDSSTTYCIAIVLHPGMKLEYFHSQKWEEEWIMQAEDLVCKVYATNYEKKANNLNAAPAKVCIKKPDNGFTLFGDLSVAGSPCMSKIQEYLSLSIENVKDPLKWWMNNRFVYPNLHHMALEYLSIPGMSYIFKFRVILICIVATSTAVE
jgi:hypothetical protein